MQSGKTGNRCGARENGQQVWSAGKRATGVERGKTGNRCGARENALRLVLLLNGCSDWSFPASSLRQFSISNINSVILGSLHARGTKRLVSVNICSVEGN